MTKVTENSLRRKEAKFGPPPWDTELEMPSRQLETWFLGQHPSLLVETPLSPLSRLGIGGDG